MDLSVEKVNGCLMIYLAKTSRGKIYTMWGPPNALLEDAWYRTDRGLTLCAYERLFSCIDEEQLKYSDKQLNFQSYCSFLEAIVLTLLDIPSISSFNKVDVPTGLCVDYLTEEFVRMMM
ncbi:unnamed protein product [Musa acuminata subsp. burmannicoides]